GSGDVDVGGKVTQVVEGDNHTCALLTTGAVRCWGDASFGQLGYANTNLIGDDETPASAGDVPVLSATELSAGEQVTQLSTGGNHACARLSTGAVRCWGQTDSGELGYGNTVQIGDDETPASAGDVPVLSATELSAGERVTQIAGGGNTACARLSTGAVRCWG